MVRARGLRVLIVAGTASVCCLPVAAAGAAGPAYTTSEVSLPRVVDANGKGSTGGTMTGDGRFVLFARQGHVYRRDLQQGVTELVSVPVPGSRRIGSSGGASLSQDGRYVALVSNEPLVAGVPGDRYSHYHAYVKDMVAGTTTLVDLRADGSTPPGGVIGGPTISGDGRQVSFTTTDPLVTADTRPGDYDVYVRDLTAGSTTLVSVTSSGARGAPVYRNSNSFDASVSRDGRFVTFTSYAVLVPQGGTSDPVSPAFYEYDLRTGTTTAVEADTTGAPKYGAEGAVSVSADRRTAVFTSRFPLVRADTNFTADAYAFDRTTRTVRLLSRTHSGSAAGGVLGAGLTPDGRYVTYNSDSREIVPGDNDNKDDGFVLDTVTGTTRIVTVRANGTQFIKPGWVDDITDDGQRATFTTIAAVSRYDNNDDFDIYLRHPA